MVTGAVKPLEIVAATVADAEVILALQRHAYLSEGKIYGMGIPPLTQTVAELRATFDHHLVLKTVAQGQLVGAVYGKMDGDVCDIGRLMVHPDWQGNGIGSRLMAAIEAAIQMSFPNIRRFRLFTGQKSHGNLALYGRLGYVQVRTESLSAQMPDGVVLVWMEKPVT